MTIICAITLAISLKAAEAPKAATPGVYENYLHREEQVEFYVRMYKNSTTPRPKEPTLLQREALAMLPRTAAKPPTAKH